LREFFAQFAEALRVREIGAVFECQMRHGDSFASIRRVAA
jgi:hypothetical protein